MGMKRLLTTFVAICSASFLFGQATSDVVELSELDVLYAKYENRIKITTDQSEDEKITLRGTNCIISAMENSGEYVVMPGSGKIATISLLSQATDGSISVVTKKELEVKVLPNPSIYWGNTKVGGKASLEDLELSIRYDTDVPFESSYDIVNWNLTCAFGTASGNGTSLTAAESLFKTINTSVEVSIRFNVKGKDGIIRQLAATWTVDPLNSEQE